MRITGLGADTECQISERKILAFESERHVQVQCFENIGAFTHISYSFHEKSELDCSLNFVVRITGLEPARVAPQTPQACASAIPPYPHIFN